MHIGGMIVERYRGKEELTFINNLPFRNIIFEYRC